MRFLPRSLHTSFLLLASCLWLPTSPPVRAVVDTNANGLSDVWEQRFNNWELFGSSFNPQTDNDGDGWTNAQEAAAGTHPFDGNPPGGVLRPGIVHLPAVFGDPDENGNPVVITPDALQVAWPTLKGKRYTLQFSTDLTLGGWSEVESPVLGNGGTLTYTFVQQSTALFWRVIVADHDSDGDEFTDWEEDQKGTDPQVADRDDDGLPDSWEIENGLNPNDNSGGNGWDGDFDNDGVSNGNELQGDGEPDDPADFPVQVIQIMKGAGGYSNMIPYEPPSKPYSGRQYSGAWWTGAGYVEVPVTDAAMTPAYLAPILDGIVFPAIPPAPPGVVQQSNLALSNIYCRSSVSRPSANSGVGTGLTSRRVWIKAPAAPVTRKFTFVKTKDLSTYVYETSTNPYTFVSAQVVTATIPANETISNPIDLKHIPTLVEGSEVIAYESFKPVELYSDLNNDGKLDEQDAKLSKKGYEGNATDAEKDKVTEFIFANDQLSNGIWDKEDTDPAKPATEKLDDDAEEIVINPGITKGEIWLDHPLIGALSFYKTRECNPADKVNLSPANKFNVTESNPFPNKLFMRADGEITYPESNPQMEGDLVLKIKPLNGQEAEGARMRLTVVKALGAKKYFHTARDYIFENNTKLLVHDWKWPIASPSTTIRMCIMREESTHMKPWESYHDDAYANYVQSGSASPFDPRLFTSCGLGIDGAANQDPEMTVVINGNQCDFTNPELPDPRTETGRIARLATLTALSGSGEALLTDRCHGRLIISQGGPYGDRNATSSDLDDPNALAPGTSFRGSYLGGDDPISGTAIPGGKYISQSGDGKFEIKSGRVPDAFYPGPQNAMGGLSASYGSSDRDNYPNSFVGYVPLSETGVTGKGVVFVAAGKGDDGTGKVKEFYDAAKASGVPLIAGGTPSDGLPIIQLVLLDSGKTSTALVHKNPAGNYHTVYKGSKHNGFPYYTNTFLRFKSTAPRSGNP